MTISVAGFNFDSPVDLLALTGGPDSSVNDGDWIIWTAYYDNTRTFGLTDTTGWTMLRQTVGSTATIEVWRYHWSTGNPTTWALSFGGTGGITWGATVVRDVASTPNLLSATHETTSPPLLIDSITNGAIHNHDVTMLVAGATNGGVTMPSAPIGNFTSSPPFLGAALIELTAAGFAPSYSLSPPVGTPTPTELLGLQLILPEVALGGWGVGMVRMGAN